MRYGIDWSIDGASSSYFDLEFLYVEEDSLHTANVIDNFTVFSGLNSLAESIYPHTASCQIMYRVYQDDRIRFLGSQGVMLHDTVGGKLDQFGLYYQVLEGLETVYFPSL